jgi:hypothetical protein
MPLIIQNCCPNCFLKISWILIIVLNFDLAVFHAWFFIRWTNLIINLCLATFFKFYRTILFKFIIHTLEIFWVILMILNCRIVHWISYFFIDIKLLWLYFSLLILHVICIFFNFHIRCFFAILILFWGFDVRRLCFYLNAWYKTGQSTLTIIFSEPQHLFIVNVT